MGPNIILINCDDLGYGDLGCYGSTMNKTPNIDRLAEEGMRFTDFYMASPACSPSRGAMMTGCYPPRIGFGSFDGIGVLFPGQGCGLSQDEETIASVLKGAGYNTMIIGKWHCGDQPEFLPTRHGFDKFYGLPYSNDMGRQVSQVPWNAPPLPLIEGEEIIQQQPDMAALTERYTEKAIGFIRENKNKPFFLYMAHMYVHLPLYAPEQFTKWSNNGDFGAVMGCLDWSVGAMMHELKKCGLDENTLVIFTSDNGGRNTHGGSNWPLRGTKATSWEGGFRVPCIARWPGKIAPGSVNNDVACSIDFFSTLSSIAGAAPKGKHKIDSLDISDSILKGGESPRKTFFYYSATALEAVRHGKWKLKVKTGRTEHKMLYDLEADISENVNVYNENPDVVKELTRLLDECREDLGDSGVGLRGTGEYIGVTGKNVRPIGRVENPVPLTEYDPDHPYIIAMYDKGDRG